MFYFRIVLKGFCRLYKEKQISNYTNWFIEMRFICFRWFYFGLFLASPIPETLFKKLLWHRCFPVSLSKVLWKPLFIEHLWASESKMFCEISTGSVLWKKLLLKLSQYSQEKLLLQSLASRPATLLKKTPAQVFSCEYCKIFKNIYLEERLPTAAFGKYFFCILTYS